MKIQLLVISLLMLCVSACAVNEGSNHSASSLVDYLYPDQERIVEPAIPHLTLPLRVGVAFVPDGYQGTFSEAQKMELMTRVANDFKQYSYIKNVELIPSAYLRQRGSFANLDQLQRMFGIDVVALISYDQMQFSDEGLSSLAYWTLVGAYFVKGEKNDTHTLLDAAVYDIKSRQLLFRAPGTSHIKSRATLVNASEVNRDDGARGMEVASDMLVENLSVQLQGFEQKVKQSPSEYKVSHRSGFSGGGSIGGLILVFWVGIGLIRLLTLRR